MNIFENEKYRQIIRAFIDQQPRRGRGFIKALSEHLNVNSSYVSQVLAGDRDFSEEQAIHTTQFMGLNSLETDYFLTLLNYEKAGSALLKSHYRKKIDLIKKDSLNLKERVNPDRVLTDSEKSIFYSSYIYSAVRLYTSINEGKSLIEIAERFEISTEKTQEILNFLTSTNLCKNDGGLFTMGTQHTHVGKNSPFLSRHHHNWRVKALEHTERVTDEEIQFTGPVSLSQKSFLKVREILVQAIQQSLEEVKESPSEEVACLMIDWFWLNK